MLCATAGAIALALTGAPALAGPTNTNRALAYRMALRAFHSQAQATCLVEIIGGLPADGWSGEDNAWLTEVPGQSVYGSWGLPQADPGTKMAAAGARWMSDARTQLRWMIRYVGGPVLWPGRGFPPSYSSPCAGLAHELAFHWY